MSTDTPLTEDEQDHAALRDAMVFNEGIRRVGRLSATASIHRNMKAEDRLNAVSAHAHNSVMFQTDPAAAYAAAEKAIPALDSEEDDSTMGDILAGGAVTINNYHGTTGATAATETSKVASEYASPSPPEPVAAAPLAASAPTAAPFTSSPEKGATTVESDVKQALAELNKKLERVTAPVPVSNPTWTTNNQLIPKWLIGTLIASAIGGPITAGITSYMLRPSPPKTFRFDVVEGIPQKDSAVPPQ